MAGFCVGVVDKKNILNKSAVKPGDVLMTVLFVHLFCLFASLVPACRAARMDPVEALRQE